MAKLTIDGKEIEVADGTRLFDACTLARGEALPHFCYHPDLSVAGVCRLCQVEVEGMPKLTIACNTTVRDGMVVHTKNERVRKAAQQVLEMHLINHPVDCPICDQAGECGLQNQYMEYGLYDSEVEEADKVNKKKAQVIGPQVILDKERCVLCSRCVRFCNEVTGTGELGIYNRGDRAEIGTAPGIELDNNYSLNTVDICPVGALTSRDFRFQKRVWMLKSTESICTGCATGCNVRIDHEAGRIYRLKPRRNAEVNGAWMCDKGRMTYKGVHDEKRLLSPAAGGERLTWADAGQKLAAIAGAGVGLYVGSAHQTLEELWLLRRAAAGAPVSGGLANADRGQADALLLDADRTPNRAGLSLLGVGEDEPAQLAERIRKAQGAVVILGGDPAAEPAVAEALGGRTVVYVGTHRNATAQLATLALPGATWAEKAGIMVNRQGRLQELRQAVARAGDAREDWRILAELPAVRGDAPASLRALRQAAGADLGLDLTNLPASGLAPAGAAAPKTGGDA
ncbi:MAG TPA: 2Fe-2S iron-sulfur cluster-binding protein [Candidatus Krumholzibacteria bacterium]|nr:2Fe-2S iron-sulfur cluster-binding protein [Candidatus Krumholzibacteria bacterium]